METTDNTQQPIARGQRLTRRKKDRKNDPLTGVMSRSQRWIHYALCGLILTLIFEGLARKLAPSFVGILIFFLKDLITVFLLYLCLTGKPNAEASRWLGVMGILVGLLGPCILFTAIHDPALAVFGAKQYVLFATVTVATCMAYLPNHQRQFFWLFRLVAFSVVITTMVAVLQNRLPADHWLNLSVTGEDLGGFSAGGYLRVSSTFSFVGQYCSYLNALCYCLPVYFYFRKSSRKVLGIILMTMLIGLAVVGSFVTGSRGAVIGNAAILAAGGVLAMVCGGGKCLFKVIMAAVIGAVLFGMLRSQFPEYFAAYQARVEGTGEVSHNVEIEKRVKEGLLDWMDGSAQAPPSFFGYGLGVMSNGSEKLSKYAAQWRSSGFWTETDQATTFFEGGWYLVLVWYGFRFWVIGKCLVLVLELRRLEFRLMACFAWGFILVIGITGNLGIQPPQAIWWWLAVGLISCLSHFDGEPSVAKISSKPDENLMPEQKMEHPFIVTR